MQILKKTFQQIKHLNLRIEVAAQWQGVCLAYKRVSPVVGIYLACMRISPVVEYLPSMYKGQSFIHSTRKKCKTAHLNKETGDLKALRHTRG